MGLTMALSLQVAQHSDCFFVSNCHITQRCGVAIYVFRLIGMIAAQNHSPQTRHRAIQGEAEKLGFMRVTEGSPFVANTATYGVIRKTDFL